MILLEYCLKLISLRVKVAAETYFLQTNFEILTNFPICRSLVTKLDAANHFTVSHLENSANWEVVTDAQTVYSAGFFLTVSVESMLKVSFFLSLLQNVITSSNYT